MNEAYLRFFKMDFLHILHAFSASIIDFSIGSDVFFSIIDEKITVWYFESKILYYQRPPYTHYSAYRS